MSIRNMAPDAVPSWRHLLPGSLRDFPADLVAAALVVGLVFVAVLVPGVRETPLRLVVGLPFLLLVPGYTLLSVLFPARRSTSDGDAAVGSDSGVDDGETGMADTIRDSGLSTLERVVLAGGTSVALLALLGAVLDGTAWGLALTPTLVAVGGLSLCFAFLGARRRLSVPPSRRPDVPLRAALGSLRGLPVGASRAERLLTLVVLVTALGAGVSVGYAVSPDGQSDNYTEFYLLTEAPDGTLAADGYPTELTAGTPESLVVGVTNHERESVTYTVVTSLDRVDGDGETAAVLERRELDRYTVTLAHEETSLTPRTVTPELAGERLRLTYRLYRGDPPVTDTLEAYRTVHLWVDVDGDGGAA